jgi:hypothetical protein
MNKNFTGFILVILLLFQFSCSSKKAVKTEDGFDDLMATQRELINDNIADQEKRANLISILEKVDKESKRFFEFDAQQKKTMIGLIKNYNTSHQDFESEMTRTDQKLENYFNFIIKKRREMRSLCTKDEWVKIMDRKTAFIPAKKMED